MQPLYTLRCMDCVLLIRKSLSSRLPTKECRRKMIPRLMGISTSSSRSDLLISSVLQRIHTVWPQFKMHVAYNLTWTSVPPQSMTTLSLSRQFQSYIFFKNGKWGNVASSLAALVRRGRISFFFIFWAYLATVLYEKKWAIIFPSLKMLLYDLLSFPNCQRWIRILSGSCSVP